MLVLTEYLLTVCLSCESRQNNSCHFSTKTMSESAEDTRLRPLFTLFPASVNTVHLDAEL